MKTYRALIALSIYLCLALMTFSFIFVCFFLSNLSSTLKLQNEINKSPSVLNVLINSHQTRAMSVLYATDKSADEEILKELEKRTINLALEANMSYDFISEVQRLRYAFDTNISPALMVEEIEALDRHFFSYFENTLSLNIIPKINGEMVALNTAIRDIIYLNKVRDFLIRFVSNGNVLDNEKIQILDELRFKFLNYATVAKANASKINFLFFNAKMSDKSMDELIALQRLNKENITTFYDTLREVMISGKLISPLKLIEQSSRIEEINIKIANLLISSIQNNIKVSIDELFSYTAISSAVFAFCAGVFVFVLFRRKKMLDDMKISLAHVENIKKIAHRRGLSVKDSQILKLISQGALRTDKFDVIDENYKSEYSYFMDNITHGIINPLNDIMGYAELLRIKKISLAQIDSYAKEILISSENLSKLFNNLIKISNIQSKNITLNHSEIDLFDGVTGLVNDFSLIASKEHIDFMLYVDPNLESNIICDTEKLRFILTTLVENAIKHNRKNGKFMLVIKKGKSIKDEMSIHLSIIDKGHGFKEMPIKQNFDDKDETKLKIFAQKGLDLAIINEYAKLMQSTGLRIRSKENEGSLIELSFNLKFKPKEKLKNKFAGEKIYIYNENIQKENDLPNFGKEPLLSDYDILCSYLDYLGLEYELTEEKDKGLYFIYDDKEPFDTTKCIFVSPNRPAFTNEDKVWLSYPFTTESLASAYELVTGKLKSTSTSFKLDAQALVLTSADIANEISKYLAHIHTTLNPETKYDIAFIDIDEYPNTANHIAKGVQLVAISKESTLPNLGKGVYSNYIIKPQKDDQMLSISKGITLALSELRRKSMLNDKYLRDILLFKKSLAANNIYKSAIITFAPRTDVANSIDEFEELLAKHTYKIVLCDFDITGLNLDRYLELINKARAEHKFASIAGLFVSPESKLVSKEFEILQTNLSKAKLETKLRQYLSSVYDY